MKLCFRAPAVILVLLVSLDSEERRWEWADWGWTVEWFSQITNKECRGGFYEKAANNTFNPNPCNCRWDVLRELTSLRSVCIPFVLLQGDCDRLGLSTTAGEKVSRHFIYPSNSNPWLVFEKTWRTNIDSLLHCFLLSSSKTQRTPTFSRASSLTLIHLLRCVMGSRYWGGVSLLWWFPFLFVSISSNSTCLT